MAVAYYRAGQVLGWVPIGPSGTINLAINAAATWFAFSFIPDVARTLSVTRCFFGTVTGTLGASDVTCDLYDSAGSGSPGSAIESGKLPSATITVAGWYSFTGFTTALTAGQEYWVVWKNVNGTPASNFPTVQSTNSTASAFLFGSSANRFAWARASSTNSGSTWALGTGTNNLRVAYADGSYDGTPVSAGAAAGVGDGVYSARESGVKFTSPANGVLKVAGVAMFVGIKTGSPTGNPRFGLWTGSTPSNLAYTNNLPTTAITTAQWVYSYFSSTQTLQPGTVTRVTLAETTQSDASTNRWNNQEITWDTDSNSLALLPFEGTCVKTYFDGSSTWTDTAGSIFPFALLLDTAGEFGAGASSGVPSQQHQIWFDPDSF